MKADLRQGNLGQEAKSPYYEKRKYPEPTLCDHCNLIYHKGRWQANTKESVIADKNLNHALCPACHRIKDREPGGLVYLGGSYLNDAQKLDEIINVVKNQEKLAQMHRPLLRIMWIERNSDGVEIATTNIHLAQRLGKAIHSAHAGTLDIKYTPGTRFARIYWKRDT